ncbi:MAG: HAMP domain-containing histidine kinase, partial [Thermomicrobiales bacterium]|nr:HAMP domain-containing histidine kinase [Thermomicrobiales bacterium]
DVRVLTFLVPAVILLAIGGSWLLVNSALKPVQQITESARQIGDESLDRRLPVERSDEIGELAMTFNDLLARLEIAMNERDDVLDQHRRFLADASHELRTPLTAIRGYTAMLAGWGLSDPAIARESVTAIDRNATRMSMMIEQLMLLARGDDPDLSPNLSRIDLAELVRGAASDASHLAEDRISIVTRTPETAFAEVDGMQIRQVLDLLLDNALKYTPDGGTIAVDVTRSPGMVAVIVTDSGPGIPQDQLPFVFDRFYRADPSRSTPGAGLGLAIGKQVVARHGGSLTAENAPQGGARFVMRLPSGGSIPVSPGMPAIPHSRPATPSTPRQSAAGSKVPDPEPPAPAG